MVKTISLDGVPTQLINPDLDNDGVVGGVESITKKFGENVTNITQSTEVESGLKELNKDDIENSSKQSALDLRTRLTDFQIVTFSGYEFLVELGVMPRIVLPLTKQIKRNLVSKNGLGRDEMIRMTGTIKEQQIKMAGGGMMSGFKGLFGGMGQR